MRKTFLSTMAFFLVIAFSLISCKKGDADGGGSTPDPKPGKSSRLVKYEITGNYTGKLNIITTTNTAAMMSYNDISVPWTKEVTYPNNVQGVGIGGNSGTVVGVAGQSVTLKVYSGDKLLYTKSSTADANGLVGFPTYAFVFQ